MCSLKSSGKKVDIMVLNDDCLVHICKQLSLRDQVIFAYSCQRFSNIFLLCARMEYKVLDLAATNQMTLKEKRIFLSLIGPHIEHIQASSLFLRNEERIFNTIYQNCMNVIGLNLYSCRMEKNTLSRLCEKMTNLTELTLRNCSLYDDFILALQKLPNLLKLSLCGNYMLTGKHINNLKTVQDLNLCQCGGLDRYMLIEIMKSLVDLHTLNLYECFFSADIEMYKEMVQHCNNLRTLTINLDNVVLAILPKLPALTNLELCYDQPCVMKNITRMLNKLDKFNSNQLECLIIAARNVIDSSLAAKLVCMQNLKMLMCNNNDNLNDECLHYFSKLENLEELSIRNSKKITNDGLLDLLRNCKYLRIVDIQDCLNIDDEFVQQAIVLLRKINHTRSLPVTFLVIRSGIAKSIIENTEYIRAAKEGIISLSFNLHAFKRKQRYLYGNILNSS